MKIIIDEIPMDLNAVKLLARVAETRSFTQAAVSLGLTQSGLSRAIGRLEAELGVRLLHRTTRSVSLTPDGQLFYERCAPLLAELEEVEKLLVDRQCAPSGPLKITTPQALGRIVIMPVLRELTRRYPQLQIEAAMTDRLVDLTEEGFDAAVRLGRVGDVRLIARPLAALRWVTVASPEYLRSHGTPERLEQLAGHNCPTVRDLHTGKLLEWQFQRDGQPLSLAVRGDLVLDVADALVDAALIGQGIVQVMGFMAEEAIRRRRLVRILQPFEPPLCPVSLIYPPSRQCSLKIGALYEELKSAHWCGALTY